MPRAPPRAPSLSAPLLRRLGGRPALRRRPVAQQVGSKPTGKLGRRQVAAVSLSSSSAVVWTSAAIMVRRTAAAILGPLLPLLCASSSSSALTGTASSARTTVALHARVACRGRLTFSPVGSAATVTGGYFVASVPGDYQCVDPSGGSTVWHAMALPPRMGPSTPLRFADAFYSKQTGTSSFNSDSTIGAWRSLGSAGCVQTGGARGLNFGQPSCAGIGTSGDLPSFFAEPLTLAISGLHLKGAHGAFIATLGELTVRVAAGSSSGYLNATVGATATGSEPRWLTSAALSENCGSAGVAMALNANAANVSLQLSCAGSVHTPLPPTLWNAQGVPHGVQCKAAASTGYDCGRSAITLAGGAATLRSLSLRSNLVAGNDPLRPSISVPALPAVLAGITDEIGFKSPDLGRAQPRNQDGIIDVSLPPFSADKTGIKDATVAIQAAVDYARENYQVVFFPEGTYTVSDTIVARVVPRAMATGHIPGPLPGTAKGSAHGATDDFLLDGVSSRYVPNYLVGSRLGQGATIVLKPSTAGFTDASSPAYVLDFFFLNSAEIPEPNAQYRLDPLEPS